ncbi:sensor histidine kinase [Actinomycetospora lutea]|uniref:sensor histidine kinase n=1 Tax=Actinomycetospora lutea TaxID=663604 RepID=UPI0023654ED7|nr:ATP-binding protein [Actinomycetospora lutea]MDD7941990.1 sensor histidine kinase [Actinomycetospora lutea]
MAFISAGLAHDVGHELATVSFLAAAVRKDPALGADNRRRLELIEREVALVQELVTHGTGAVGAAEDVSLNQLVAYLVEPLALVGATTVVAAPGPEVRLTVDRHALWRLLGNLVGNAVRAAGPVGRVWLTVADDPVPRVEVHDDGPGPTLGPPGRHGIGLAVARSLAACCGADLTLAPDPAGGTVATLRFGSRPTSPSPASALVPASRSEQPGERRAERPGRPAVDA